MLISILEKLAIKIFETGQKRLPSFNHKEEVSYSGLYLGRSPKLYNPREEESVSLSLVERTGHFYIIGGTGIGKTTFIENCLQNDILQNRGFCLFDPHGDLSEKIVKFIAFLWQKKGKKQKEEIARRLILVEPFNQDRVTGFNPLEASEENSVYSSALELMSVFKRRWPGFFGPRMEELFRACLTTLSENKLTLLEAPILLTNREARDSLVEKLTNQEIKAYWLYRYNNLSERAAIQYREPVLNKITEFLTDENIRYLLGQTGDTLNFRKAMDEGKWIILNIAKGKLKSNALLLGGLFLAKLQIASLSRADIPFYQRRSFYVYLDEVQNFINAKEGGDIETMLSESRKYNLSLAMAHQNLTQLDGALLNAILGNVKTVFCFRLGYKDALVLAPELNPLDKKALSKNLINLKIGQAYLKIKGKPARLVKIPLPTSYYVYPKIIEEFKNFSFSFSTKPRQEIKKEIQERQQKLEMNNRGNIPKNNFYSNKGHPWEGQNGW